MCIVRGWFLPLDGQTTLTIVYIMLGNIISNLKNTQIEVQEAHTDYVANGGERFIPSVSVQAEVGRHIGRSIDPGTNGYF